MEHELMDYPVKSIDDDTFLGLEIKCDENDKFSVTVKDHAQSITSEELMTEMRDQIDVRGSVRRALLRKATKALMVGLKKGRLRLDEEQQEAFDLNLLIWFADKASKGEHQAYLAK